MKLQITNGWRRPVNLSLTKKYENFRTVCSDILWKLPPPLLAGMTKCQAPQLIFTVDFKAFSAYLAVENIYECT